MNKEEGKELEKINSTQEKLENQLNNKNKINERIIYIHYTDPIY